MLRPLFRTYRSQWECGLESSTGHTLPAAEARRAPSIRDEGNTLHDFNTDLI